MNLFCVWKKEAALCFSNRHFWTNLINFKGSDSKFEENKMKAVPTEHWQPIFGQLQNESLMWNDDSMFWLSRLFSTNEFLTRNLSFALFMLLGLWAVRFTPKNMFRHRKVQGLSGLAKIYYPKTHDTRWHSGLWVNEKRSGRNIGQQRNGWGNSILSLCFYHYFLICKAF